MKFLGIVSIKFKIAKKLKRVREKAEGLFARQSATEVDLWLVVYIEDYSKVRIIRALSPLVSYFFSFFFFSLIISYVLKSKAVVPKQFRAMPHLGFFSKLRLNYI